MFEEYVLGKERANCFTKGFQAKCILLKQIEFVIAIGMSQCQPERIYNPTMSMGILAMFTFQLDNTKK